MAAQLAPLTASVTRILSLSGFPPELKTRDIQAAFGDWENVNGGFKIKWRDDTSLLIVFSDAATAKRAYLQTLASPPAVFTSPTSSKTASIRPYDGPDAQAVIQAVNARSHGHNNSRGHHSRSSFSSGSINGLQGVGGGGGRKGNGGAGTLSSSTSLNALASIPAGQPLVLPREASPTLPNIPNQPTLNALINSSLSPVERGEGVDLLLPPQGSAAVPIVAPTGGAAEDGGQGAAPARAEASGAEAQSTPPRIGDPGRRMVGHALGIRHPGLAASNRTGSPGRAAGIADQTIHEVQRSMGGLTVTSE